MIARPEHLAPLLHRKIVLPGEPDAHLFEVDLDLTDPELAYLADYVVHGEIYLVASALLEIALEGAHQVYGTRAAGLCDVRFVRAVALSTTEPTRLQLLVRGDGAVTRFQIFARRDGSPAGGTLHAEGGIAFAVHDTPAQRSIVAIQKACTRAVSVRELDDRLAANGFELGPAFRQLDALWVGDDELLARVRSPIAAGGHRLHPLMLDACLQAGPIATDGALEVERGLAELTPLAREPVAWVHARMRRDGLLRDYDYTLLAVDGRVVATARGMRTEAISAPAAVDRTRRKRSPAQQQLEAREAVEATLATLWTELLGLEQVGRNDNLFELGGDSLLVMRLVAGISRKFGVELKPHAVFVNPTIAAQAAHLEEIMRAGASPENASAEQQLAELVGSWSDAEVAAQLVEWSKVALELAPTPREPALSGARRELVAKLVAQHHIDAYESQALPRRADATCEATFTQRRMWDLHVLDSAVPLSNRQGFAIRGPLDARALQKAVAALVGRQRALRTVFALDGPDRLIQTVCDRGPELEVVDLSSRRESERMVEARALFDAIGRYRSRSSGVPRAAATARRARTCLAPGGASPRHRRIRGGGVLEGPAGALSCGGVGKGFRARQPRVRVLGLLLLADDARAPIGR